MYYLERRTAQSVILYGTVMGLCINHYLLQRTKKENNTSSPHQKKKKKHVSPMRIEKCIYLGTNLRVYEMV